MSSMSTLQCDHTLHEDNSINVGCGHVDEVGRCDEPGGGAHASVKVQTTSQPRERKHDPEEQVRQADLIESPFNYQNPSGGGENHHNPVTRAIIPEGSIDINSQVNSRTRDSTILKRFVEHYLQNANNGEPETRYEKWLKHKRMLEEGIRTYEARKAQFLLRWTSQSGDRPSINEIIIYEKEKVIYDMKRRELKGIVSKIKPSFGLTTLPRTTNDALDILRRMAPIIANVYSPNELHDGDALAAPGGVIDEVEIHKAVEMIKDMMMKAKTKAFEERMLKEIIEGEWEVPTKGRKSNGMQQVNGNVQDSNDAKDDNEGIKAQSFPDEGLWYSTSIYPQLSEALLEVSKVLKENLGTTGALSALNTALTEEAVAIDKACSILFSRCMKKIKQTFCGETGVTDADVERLCKYLPPYNRRLYSLGGAWELFQFLDSLGLMKLSQKLLHDFIKGGFGTAEMYLVLGRSYQAEPCTPSAGIEAEKYFLKASECQPSRPNGTMAGELALIGRVTIYAEGCHPIQADPVYAAYLLSKVLSSCGDNERLTLARMYRYGFMKTPDYDEAVQYYMMMLATSNVKQVGEAVICEANDFIAMMRLRDDSIQAEWRKKDMKQRLKLLLRSIKLHPGIIYTYCEIAYQYMGSDYFDKDLKKAKEYIDKALTYLPSCKDPTSRARILHCQLKYYRQINDINQIRTHLTQLEPLVDTLPIELRLTINLGIYDTYQVTFQDLYMSLKYSNKLIHDGQFEYLCMKGTILSALFEVNPTPRHWHHTYQTLLEAEKYLGKTPNRYKVLLVMVYRCLAGMFSPIDIDDLKSDRGENCEGESCGGDPSRILREILYNNAGDDKDGGDDNDDHADSQIVPPPDREKVRYYLQKALTLGDREVWRSLGMTYSSKLFPWLDGKDDDYEKAAKCYKKSLELNQLEFYSNFELGYLFLYGRGVKQDIKKAREHYERADGEKCHDAFRSTIKKYRSEFYDNNFKDNI